MDRHKVLTSFNYVENVKNYKREALMPKLERGGSAKKQMLD